MNIWRVTCTAEPIAAAMITPKIREMMEEFEAPGRETDTDAVALLSRFSVDLFFMGLMARGKADLSLLVPRRSGREHSAFTLKHCAEFLESVEMHTCEVKHFLVLKFNFA